MELAVERLQCRLRARRRYSRERAFQSQQSAEALPAGCKRSRARRQRHRDRDTSLQPADRACSLLLLTADFRRLFLGYIDDGKVVAVRSKKRHAEKKCRKEIVYSSRFVRVIKCRKQKRNAETPPKRAAFRKKEKTKKNIKKKL